jgi:glycerol-3-phosphate O-acyltransferase / dihydroxyacetone phosphate acyltransferase
VVASLLDKPPIIGSARSLKDEVELERRLIWARRLFDDQESDPALHTRAEQFLKRVEAFEHSLHVEQIATDDVAISLQRRHGVRFALREGALLALIGPIALWGRLNHWIPFRLARVLGERDMSSRDQPAMRTILAGLVLVLLFYTLATGLVLRLTSGITAALYLATLPIAADVDLQFTERVRQARQRMRTYLRLRRNPSLREALTAEHKWLTQEIAELASALETSSRRRRTVSG